MSRRVLLGLLALVLLVPGGDAAGQGLSGRIERKRAQLEAKRARAQTVAGEVSGLSRRIGALQGEIGRLAVRQARLQAELDAKRVALLATQAELRTARARLVRLRLRLAHGRRVLARRLVALYEADRADLVTVVLSADGFAELLETGEHVSRVGAQDRRIIEAVRAARAETVAIVRRLDRLEERQRSLAAAVLARRDEVAGVRSALAERRDAYAAARGARARVLARVRSQASALGAELDDLEAEQAAVRARLRAAAAPAGTLPAGPIRGGGAWIWPVSGPITGVFGEQRPGHVHAGIDLAAPTGTPLRAVAAGRVILAGYTGGYGNYTCIQHNGGVSSCYGHQSSIGVSVGQAVSQGQVIGAVGNTGNSTGPHLHFEARVGGSAVDPMGYL